MERNQSPQVNAALESAYPSKWSVPSLFTLHNSSANLNSTHRCHGIANCQAKFQVYCRPMVVHPSTRGFAMAMAPGKGLLDL